MGIEQISVFVENSPGKIRVISGLLANAGVDIRALTIADTKDFGILRLIVDDTQKALKALEEGGCVASLTMVLGVVMQDQPGSLNAILNLMGEHDVNIDYIYAFLTSRKEDACVIFRVEELERAAEVLTLHGVKLVDQNYIQGL